MLVVTTPSSEGERTVICPACGATSPPAARHCQQCGVRLSSTSGPASGPDVPYVPSSVVPIGGRTDAAALPGTVLNGRYRLVRVLGAGSFGRVYLAEDTRDAASPPVAVKELLTAHFSSPDDQRDAVSWFKREVGALLTLEHTGIPAIYGYWTAHTTGGPFYLAMEYIPGQTLDEALQDAGGHVPWSQVAAWGLALCDVLGYLHSCTPPFVFRDLKLPNVMLDSRTNTPVLIDFGLARQLAPTGGTAIGTWGYVPYEQILGQAEPRSDLYALGATLHALLTGRHPDAEYARLQRSGLDLERTLRTLFPPADTLVPAVPAALARVITQATAFAAADRFPDAVTMAAALQQVGGQRARNAGRAATPRPMLSGLAMPTTASGPPPDIVVAPARRGHYVSIAAALRQASPGARIAVQPGLYAEALVIDRPVEIVGAGRVEDVIVEAFDAPCLTMATDNASVRGLTLRGCAGRGNNQFVAVDIPRGRLVLEDCRVTSDSLACVAIHGPTAAPVIRRCTIHDGAHAGVSVYNQAQGTMEDCDIFGHTMAGVVIWREANPVMRRCTIHDGRDAGLFVFDHGQGTVEDCDIFGHAMAGVAIKEESSPTIKGCTIHDGAQAGILVYEHGRGTVEECHIYRHASTAVGIAQGGNPLVRGCVIRDGKQDGILVHDYGQGTVEDCEIARHARSGLAIVQGGNPIVQRCTIHDGRGAGILVDDHGQGRIEGCTITDNVLAGVEIRHASHPEIYRCHVNHNGLVGIWVHHGGAGTVESCDLTGNKEGAWRVALWCWVGRQGNKER
jgi:nitrous oxidase accessory protein NosD